MEIQELIPKDKHDKSTIGTLLSLSDEQIEPILAELQTWLQDLNWPVAGDIIAVIRKHQKAAEPYLVDILRGTDEPWKYNILSSLLEEWSAPFDADLQKEIDRIAWNPTDNEIEEEVCLAARELNQSRGTQSIITITPLVITGKEDKFAYVISDDCIQCGACLANCPVNAIREEDGKFRIDRGQCIDCGTCSAVCPTGAARPLPQIRESLLLSGINPDQCYFNPGCALSLYKPDVPLQMLELLRKYYGDIGFNQTCCRYDPGLPAGSVIINNCAGCDRRFRSLYKGINTISYWEVIDAIPDLKLPDYNGLQVSVHDSCGYRHKPQVHRAIRSLLAKMNIEVIESEFSGSKSVCCGDNFYGAVLNEETEKRIRMRADQFPCDNVVVYCIGCVRAMQSGGKTPRYLPDLLLGRETESMPDTLDEYHTNLSKYICTHST